MGGHKGNRFLGVCPKQSMKLDQRMSVFWTVLEGRAWCSWLLLSVMVHLAEPSWMCWLTSVILFEIRIITQFPLLWGP